MSPSVVFRSMEIYVILQKCFFIDNLNTLVHFEGFVYPTISDVTKLIRVFDVCTACDVIR